MVAGGSSTTKKSNRLNQLIAVGCFAVIAGMIGMAYAAVPLYRIFCQVTGYEGTTRRVTQGSSRVLDQTVRVRFDANVNGVPWDFKPVQREITLKIGETREIHYTAHNEFGRTTRGRATFNVQPDFAGAYFNKIQCFCFTDTVLKPGETLDMPVVFYVDPDIVKAEEYKGMTAITLSYTMFPLDGPTAEDKPGEAQSQAAAAATGKSETHTGG